MGMHIGHWLHQYGLIAVFGMLLLENFGIPFPAETTLVFAGISWMRGDFHLAPLLAAAALGNTSGAVVAYFAGYYLGLERLKRRARLIRLREEHIDTARKWFIRYEAITLVLSKYIAGVRVVVPYLAGINEVGVWRFAAYSFAGALAWSATFVILGRYIDFAWVKYSAVFYHYLGPFIMAAVIVSVGYVFIKRRRDKNVP